VKSIEIDIGTFQLVASPNTIPVMVIKQFSAASVATTLALLVRQSSMSEKVCLLSPVGREISNSDRSKTIFPPTSFSSRPLDEQRVRTAGYRSFGKGKSAHILPMAA
jgi:hypothetical protein